MGRYRVTVTTISVPPEIEAMVAELRKVFECKGHQPNFVPGSWSCRQQSANQVLAVERAALSRMGVFKAAGVKAIVGAGTNVTTVLSRLVEDGRLTRVGKKRYVVTPPKPVERVDWTG